RKGFKILTDKINACSSQVADERLVQMALAYFNFAIIYEAYYKLMFGLGIPSCDKAKEISEIAEFSSLVVNAIEQLMESPNDDQLRLKFHSFWSILHGLTSINMVSATAAPNHLQQEILLDIVQGF